MPSLTRWASSTAAGRSVLAGNMAITVLQADPRHIGHHPRSGTLNFRDLPRGAVRNLFHKLGVASRVDVARVVERADRDAAA